MKGLATIRKGQKGFTLVELMVVVAILAVLMAIVVPAISQTKGVSVEGQVKSDADAVQKAVQRFNNDSIEPGQFPDKTLVTAYATEFATTPTVALTLLTKNDGTITVEAFAATTGDDRRVGINFNDSVEVYSGNNVDTATFVPDFLTKEPGSLDLLANDSGKAGSTEKVKNILHEFIWVMRVSLSGEGGANESRTVEVYRLTDAAPGTTLPTATYTQIF